MDRMNRMLDTGLQTKAGAPASPALSDVQHSATLLTVPELALHLRAWQRPGWEQGQLVSVEQLLAEYPKISDDPDSVVDLISESEQWLPAGCSPHP